MAEVLRITTGRARAGSARLARPERRPRAGRALRAVLLAWAASAIALAGAWAGPSVGEPAPPFSLQGSDGRTYTLESVLADHEGVVLAWFPKAFTPG